MILPIEENKYEVSSPYGKRIPIEINGKKGKDFHNGTDFSAPKGTPVRATANGTVIQVGYNDTFGNYVEIRHSESTTTFYAHMDTTNINVNDIVSGGEVIGTVGTTGFSTGPHLHYEIRIDGKPSDPHL